MTSKSKTMGEIDRKILRIATLETRRGEFLDFHNVAVGELRTELETGFEPGHCAAFNHTNEGTKR